MSPEPRRLRPPILAGSPAAPRPAASTSAPARPARRLVARARDWQARRAPERHAGPGLHAQRRPRRDLSRPWPATTTCARASGCTWSPPRPRPTRSGCWRPAGRISRSWTSTIWPSPASAARTSSGSWRSSSDRWPRLSPRPEITHAPSAPGQLAGVTGVPSDTGRAGLGRGRRGRRPGPGQHDHDRLQRGRRTLLAGRVAAATAFWNDEGVTLRRRRPGFHVFRVDRYGAPAYPELVLCATEPACAPPQPGLASHVVRALVQGYGQMQAIPRPALRALNPRSPGSPEPRFGAELRALVPGVSRILRGSGRRAGRRSPEAAWARWEAPVRDRQPPARRGAMFDYGLARSGTA